MPTRGLQGPIPVEFGHVFPRGAFAAGGFEPVRDFDASKRGRFVQSKDDGLAGALAPLLRWLMARTIGGAA